MAWYVKKKGNRISFISFNLQQICQIIATPEKIYFKKNVFRVYVQIKFIFGKH